MGVGFTVWLYLVCLFAPRGVFRQTDVLTSPADDSIFRKRIEQIHSERIAALPIGERIVRIGKLFLGTPYVGGTLDLDSTAEPLIINLHGLDCATFYENMLALARVVVKYPNPTFQNYEDEITFLRYRDGLREGFHSRLHYSVDYFYDNGRKGVMRDKTRQIGGSHAVLETAKIDFMSTHRDLYKQIRSNDREYGAIREMEDSVNGRGGYYFIPKSAIQEIESGMRSGDILGITTDFHGLDCSHTGIAIRETDGRIHFMHASSLMHKVIITEEPLTEYLSHNTHQTGIIINRPLEVLQN